MRLVLSEPTGADDGTEQVRRILRAGMGAEWGRGEHLRHCLQLQECYLTRDFYTRCC